jgi:pimeloyl-ACP methyl ester carboxylesterase
VLYPQLQEIDLRTQSTTLEVPVYLAQGRTRRPAARSGAGVVDRLQAPRKEMFTFDTSGHRPLWEQPERSHK